MYYTKENCSEIVGNNERLKVFDTNPGIQRLLYEIRGDDCGGEPFRRRLRMLAYILGSKWIEEQSPFSLVTKESPFGPIQEPVDNNPPLIVSIPRGGVPMGEGLAGLLPQSACFYTNDGENKNPAEPLLPENFPTGGFDNVFIADAIVGAGKTIKRTIESIKQITQVNHFFLFSAVASETGTNDLLAKYLNLSIYTCCIEPRYEWVQIGGEQVFFVHGIGDVGKLVTR